MGVITNLENRVSELVQKSAISAYVYDRLDSINEDAKNNYPLLLFRVDTSTTPDVRKKTQYPQLTVDFYLSDLYYQGDTNTIAQKKDTLDELLLALINTIPDYQNSNNRQNNFELLASSEAEYAWDQHNDNVIIVKRTVQIRGFQCITKLE